MALISNLSARARRDEPPMLVTGPALTRTIDGRRYIAIPAGRATTRTVPPESRLVFDLEAIRSPSHAEQFVRSYGLLRHGPDDIAPDQELREPFDEWQDEIARIRFIGTLVILAHGAERGDGAAVGRLRSLLGDPVRGVPDDDVLRLASGVVQVNMNERLGESRWQIRADALDDNRPAGSGPGRPNVFWFAARPVAPGALPYAHWQLADLLVARAPLAECDGCGRFYEQRDPRQRFHDEACRQRAGYRRRRAAEKETP
jgi:hypothetical protein